MLGEVATMLWLLIKAVKVQRSAAAVAS